MCDACTIALDVPRWMVWDGPEIKGGPSPFFFFRPSRVFDTRTRLLYDFPEFRIALDETRYKINHKRTPDMDVMLTNTHVFGFFYCWLGERKQYMTLIQAFTVPDDQPLANNRNGTTLRLTHEGTMSHRSPSAVIRNSIVDPITGSIGVRFLCQWIDHDGFHPKCVDVTLPKPSLVDVSPITVHWHGVRTNENRPLHDHQDGAWGYKFLSSLGDGYARGLFTQHYGYPASGDACSANREGVVKFTIDATRDCCVATLSECLPLPMEWNMNPQDRSISVCFDGIRGRLCYIEEEYRVLVVIDFE
ncbi:hypothetical protein OG21DRAFT_656539 [Imleria badia]|nr:hypothetical protein OG21DRAFT_656539 [Imleria badia]